MTPPPVVRVEVVVAGGKKIAFPLATISALDLGRVLNAYGDPLKASDAGDHVPALCLLLDRMPPDGQLALMGGRLNNEDEIIHAARMLVGDMAPSQLTGLIQASLGNLVNCLPVPKPNGEPAGGGGGEGKSWTLTALLASVSYFGGGWLFAGGGVETVTLRQLAVMSEQLQDIYGMTQGHKKKKFGGKRMPTTAAAALLARADAAAKGHH